ncbi:hypothetical protein ACIA5C_46535 [Actinoplanes sp. NPDC051343]|uniref:hypothetical protein n=1 Tax=Actinoplanes sp. NPDC051343 TaxID=3363906 RepID=UPI0037B561C1
MPRGQIRITAGLSSTVRVKATHGRHPARADAPSAAAATRRRQTLAVACAVRRFFRRRYATETVVVHDVLADEAAEYTHQDSIISGGPDTGARALRLSADESALVVEDLAVGL